MEAVGVVFLILVLIFVLVGIPMLSRALIRRLAGSEGFRAFIDAYGPRFPMPGRDEPDDGGDA